MKTTHWAFALALGTWCLLPGFSIASGPNGSLSLDGQLSRRISGVIGHDYGMGGSLQLEFQPVQAFSIGVGADLLDFVGVNTPGQSFIESLNLTGRIILNAGEPWQPYLTGGYGINPKIDLQGNYTWWGNYHVMGGLGTWYFFDPQWALDFAALYNYYNDDPRAALQTINVRLGFSYFFGPALKKHSITGRFADEGPRPQAGDVQPVLSGFDQTHRPNQRASNPPKDVESTPVKPAAQVPAMKSGASSTTVKSPASKPQAERQSLGVPISKKEMGAQVTPVPSSKTMPTSAAIPQGSAIGPKGLASFRGEPAPTIQTPAPKVKAGTPITTAKTPAAKLRAGQQALGVPIPKKGGGTPAPVAKAASKKSLVQVDFREPAGAPQTPGLKAKQVSPAPVTKAGTQTSKSKPSSPAPVAKKSAQSPASKIAPAPPLGQVAFREAAPATKSQTDGERTKRVESAKKGADTPAPSVKAMQDNPEGPSEITTKKGQSLWDTAARKDVYGDPGLYPLLLDANRKVLKSDQMALPAGMKLAVPRGVSGATIQKARINAWTNDYMRYRGMGLSKSAYEKWRKSISK